MLIIGRANGELSFSKSAEMIREISNKKNKAFFLFLSFILLSGRSNDHVNSLVIK